MEFTDAELALLSRSIGARVGDLNIDHEVALKIGSGDEIIERIKAEKETLWALSDRIGAERQSRTIGVEMPGEGESDRG